MTLRICIPEDRPLTVVSLQSLDDLRTTRYFVYTQSGQRIDPAQATEKEAVDTASEIGNEFQIEDEGLLYLSIAKQAFLSGTISQAIRRSTGLFGGQEAWDRLQEWQRMKEKETNDKK